MTALSKATRCQNTRLDQREFLSDVPSSWAISSTIAKSSLSLVTSGYRCLIWSAFCWDRTVVTTECPWARRRSTTWAPRKPLPPEMPVSIVKK